MSITVQPIFVKREVVACQVPALVYTKSEILSFRDSEQKNRSARGGAPQEVTDGVLISFLIGLNKLHSEEFMEISNG